MQNDPYLILGVSKDATQEEIKAAYESLRAQYSADLFEEGEKGANASRMLNRLEEAYNECLELQQRNVHVSGGTGSYGDITQLIKDGKLEQAQEQLDNIEYRDGEWHYLQAVIYHRRNWNVESKKQLEIALAIDANNEKYQRALDNLKRYMQGEAQPRPDAAQGGQTRAGYSRPDAAGSEMDRNANACCNTCSTLICCDCCCECMGGDLIPCC